MEIREATVDEYFGIFTNPAHVFNSRSFIELNASKCDEIRFLIFSSGGKARLGLILGGRGDTLGSPFSAPFGGFDIIRDPGVETFAEAMAALKEYASSAGCGIRLTLPPLFYDRKHLPLVAALAVNDPEISATADYNYHFECADFARYEEVIDRSARKNLNTARRSDFRFEVLSAENPADVARAYEVIRINRGQHGYPLHMSLQAVLDTIKIIPAEFFVLTLDGADVAAAQVFYVAPRIAQVIYWGDVAGYSDRRPMNMLSYSIFRHLASRCDPFAPRIATALPVDIIDIGPSSSDGIPSPGLCNFKTSLACLPTLKYTLTI